MIGPPFVRQGTKRYFSQNGKKINNLIMIIVTDCPDPMYNPETLDKSSQRPAKG